MIAKHFSESGKPDIVQNPKKVARIASSLFIISDVCLAIAPFFIESSYSSIRHSISESAAQALPNAWISRLGFQLFGWGALTMVLMKKPNWSQAAVWGHTIFGVMLLATAAFSHKPYLDYVQADLVEDRLHSFTATVMGFAFVYGVHGRLIQKRRHGEKGAMFDVIVIVVSTVVPIGMGLFPAGSGALQRVMFFAAYCWYLREVWGKG